MKKNLLFPALVLALALGLLLPLCPMARAEQFGLYLTPKLVYGVQKFDMKESVTNGSMSLGSHSENVFGAGLAAGYDFGLYSAVPVRAELEYATFTEAKGSSSGRTLGQTYNASGKVDVDTLFLNAYYDFHNETRFTPYLGVGLGLSFLSMKGSDTGNHFGRHDETNFAWNAGLGCAYLLTEGVSLDLGYRYANLGEAKTESLPVHGISSLKTDDVTMHQFMLGARFSF